jgi:hypothetical protein
LASLIAEEYYNKRKRVRKETRKKVPCAPWSGEMPCWGVLLCDQALLAPPRSSSSANCTCASVATNNRTAFALKLHAGLASRRRLMGTDFLAARAISDDHYHLLAHGLLTYLKDLEPDQAGRSIWLEFGVASARSTNITCNALPQQARVHGFDSFEGLPQAWGSMAAGRFSQGGHIPPVHECATLHKGLITKASIRSWMKSHGARLDYESAARRLHILGVSIDVDLYEPSLAALTQLDSHLASGALLHFHEIVKPYGPADSNVYNAIHRPFHADGRLHPSQALALKRARREPPDDSPEHQTHEERALFDALRRQETRTCWWLVPVVAAFVEPALFIRMPPHCHSPSYAIQRLSQ